MSMQLDNMQAKVDWNLIIEVNGGAFARHLNESGDPPPLEKENGQRILGGRKVRNMARGELSRILRRIPIGGK